MKGAPPFDQRPARNASYNALQVSFDKRYSHGFTILASYTWSKALDYQSRNQAAQDAPLSHPFNFFLGHGSTTADRRHRFISSYVWDLPSMAHGAVAKALRGTGSSPASSPCSRGASSRLGPRVTLVSISGARVDLGAGNPVLRFQNPAPNTLGTLGRNILEGPGLANVDISMVYSSWSKLHKPHFRRYL